MSNVENVQFLFKLSGKCDVEKNSSGMYLKIWNYGNLFCYQGWDRVSYNFNARRRKTFTMPITQYVSAINNYNSNHHDNHYRPALVISLSNNNVAIVTASSFSIGPYSRTNSNETLRIKIEENYQRHNNDKHMKLNKNNSLDDALKYSHSVKMNFLFSEFSYYHLNFNNYLSSKEIPFKKSDLYKGWLYPLFSELDHPYGKGIINYNYLFQDKGKIQLTKSGFKVVISNPSHIVEYQGWNQFSFQDNYSLNRKLNVISASDFMLLMHRSEKITVEKYGAPPDMYAFQPTTFLEIENMDGSEKHDIVAVLKSFELMSNFGDTNLEIEFSILQVSTIGLGRQSITQLDSDKEYLIRMDIDASDETATASTSPDDFIGLKQNKTTETPVGFFDSLSLNDYKNYTKEPNYYIENPIAVPEEWLTAHMDGTPSASELCCLTILFNQTLDVLDRNIADGMSLTTAARTANASFEKNFNNLYNTWGDIEDGKKGCPNASKVAISKVADLQCPTEPKKPKLSQCDWLRSHGGLSDEQRKKLCPTDQDKIDADLDTFGKSWYNTVLMLVETAIIFGVLKYGKQFVTSFRNKAESGESIAGDIESLYFEGRMAAEKIEMIEKSSGMKEYQEMMEGANSAAARAEAKAKLEALEAKPPLSEAEAEAAGLEASRSALNKTEAEMTEASEAAQKASLEAQQAGATPEEATQAGYEAAGEKLGVSASDYAQAIQTGEAARLQALEVTPPLTTEQANAAGEAAASAARKDFLTNYKSVDGKSAGEITETAANGFQRSMRTRMRELSTDNSGVQFQAEKMTSEIGSSVSKASADADRISSDWANAQSNTRAAREALNAAADEDAVEAATAALEAAQAAEAAAAAEAAEALGGAMGRFIE